MYSWNETLHVSNSSSVHHQEFLLYTQQCYMSYRSADSLRAQAGMKAVPSWSCRVCIIKPNRCTNFSDLFLELNSTTLQDQDGTAVPSWSCSQAVSRPVWHITLLCLQWKTPDDGHRNCPKHVGWNILILLASCQQTCMTYTTAVCTVKNSWWWTEELSEICRVSLQK